MEAPNKSNRVHTSGAYQSLCGRFREIAFLHSAASLLDYDQETCMPPKALPFRARTGAFLSGHMHRLATAAEVDDWLKAVEDLQPETDSMEAGNVREWRRQYDRATRLPGRLVEELQEASSLARQAWGDARQKSDFTLFQPLLERLVDLCREKAEAVGYAHTPYDALLEDYESGLTSAEVTGLFGPLKEKLVPMVARGTALSLPLDAELLRGDYSISEQEQLNRHVAQSLGFDFEAGLLAISAHPFCSTIGPGDTRLTTRYDPEDFVSSLYGVIHETGHGLYAQGRPAGEFGLPSGSSASLGVDESQSRLWENHVGRSPLFWNHWWDRACQSFLELRKIDRDQFVGLINRIQPSLVRVEADEVTYDLHIILRFELEKALIEKELEPGDLPAEWNRRFKEALGIEVPDDRHGCLQDIHWSLGAFGYFPTYTLGNLNAAQIFQAARKALPDLENDLAGGRYGPLLEWLREKIHRHGRRYLPKDLVARATGEALSPEPYFAHLEGKLALLEQAHAGFR